MVLTYSSDRFLVEHKQNNVVTSQNLKFFEQLMFFKIKFPGKIWFIQGFKLIIFLFQLDTNRKQNYKIHFYNKQVTLLHQSPPFDPGWFTFQARSTSHPFDVIFSFLRIAHTLLFHERSIFIQFRVWTVTNIISNQLMFLFLIR